MIFDLVSDLHVDVHEPWTWEPQSQICVVAGDVAQDIPTLTQTLTTLGQQYDTVLYIDGNDEHRHDLHDLSGNFTRLAQAIAPIPNVVYLQDQMVILNDVAFVAANGWWSFDLDPKWSMDQTQQAVARHYNVPVEHCDQMLVTAVSDARYLAASVRRLQVHLDVRRIVMITHTVPRAELIQDDPDITGNYRINTTVNPWMREVLTQDTENKIGAWCFGHYHCQVDQVIQGIRYVSNPRGRYRTAWYQEEYAPRQIEI